MVGFGYHCERVFFSDVSVVRKQRLKQVLFGPDDIVVGDVIGDYGGLVLFLEGHLVAVRVYVVLDLVAFGFGQ